ncbi:hypothetical protein CBU02nite_37930 [Clostridium butyricum]|uniref:Uncharacterized protein n=1 Tax=Clostridium butyricum TaxID=1492 RepID=A0A512TSN3_CLOBU|nr:hypothetical protein [Clostridium butyricum]NOW25513.1 hypothetical protein [Clostridium butyricum]GEQ23287.1 hypothetical protein CBU02nite_37930 [Clostridium butyricum]
MSAVFKLVGLGDYTYKDKAKVKSKEVNKIKSKGDVYYGRAKNKNFKKRKNN